MGHWSDDLVDEVAARISGAPDRAEIKAVARQAAKQIEIYAGRAFGQSERKSVTMASGGLPFVEGGDMQIGSLSADVPVWPIPDPVHAAMSTVLQIQAPVKLAPSALSLGKALQTAGGIVATIAGQGRLRREFLVGQLLPVLRTGDRTEFLRWIADPSNRFQVPIAGGYSSGWWIQVTRRVMLVTQRTPDDRRLVEPLLDAKVPLVATEPFLILARVTTHPTDYAFAARIWTSPTRAGDARPWRTMSRAIHQYGIPVITVDDISTPEEVAYQLVLLAYWHGYLDADEPVLVDGVVDAYPGPIGRIRRGMALPDDRAAGAALLEGLLHPGFDPALGALSVRKYVSRKARITVLAHRKLARVGAHAWERVGVSERFFYKLLPRFTTRERGRWLVDDMVLEKILAHLRERDGRREVHAEAMALLQDRGFSWAAARKWLQRHSVAESVRAHPRRRATLGPAPAGARERGSAPERR